MALVDSAYSPWRGSVLFCANFDLGFGSLFAQPLEISLTVRDFQLQIYNDGDCTL